jgi:thymidylate synthase (FAD)
MKKKTEILNHRFTVLDNGFVELCNYMGNDETVVRSAKQSYAKNKDELTPEAIDRQIKFMLCNGHSSPFEQVVFQFHIRMPIFVARQWVRHRTARLNELSGRCTEFSEEDFYIPGDNEIIVREYPEGYVSENLTEDEYNMKIGKKGIIVSKNCDAAKKDAYSYYKEMLEHDIPKELARAVLPLSTYTEMYWQMDLHNLLHFFELRLEEHAQKEVREYALCIYNIVNEICPVTINHFENEILNSVRINRQDLNTLVEVLSIKNIGNKLELYENVINQVEILKKKLVDKSIDFYKRDLLFDDRQINNFVLEKRNEIENK